jgi:exopolysaccharide biosynthesis predicted pyruvyltransferase EpsI
MALLPASEFAPIFEPFRGLHVGYVRGQYGNVGDALIHLGTLQMFSAFDIRFKIVNEQRWQAGVTPKIPDGIEHLVLFGGGNMGAPASGGLRNLARSLGIPATLLPQSWRSPEDASFAKCFTRERGSLQYCPTAELVHDLGLSYTPDQQPSQATKRLGVCLRRDAEGQFKDEFSDGDPAEGLNRRSAESYVQRAAQYHSIITDRLHFAISGLLCKRRVILLPGNYHKNRGVFDQSLQALGCEWADSPSLAREMV